MSFIFNTARSLVCEIGASRKLGEYCQTRAIRRPLIVTDQGIVGLGMLDPVIQTLEQAGLEVSVYADVVADPPEAVVAKALEVAANANCDGVLGFGGGSSLDTAKLVALLAGSGQRLEQVYGVELATGPRLPLILIPTTAGTGSEMTAVAIVTTGETTKAGVVSTHLYPDLAVLDAELTLGLPAGITAATGVDAMVHAIEAYTSVRLKNPYSDMLAKEALRLLSANIETAVVQGDDLGARQSMLLGACLAGQAFANAPVAAVHALAYPLGGHYHIPHGLSNALVLPHVMRFNLPAVSALYAELAPIVFPRHSFDTDTALGAEALIEQLQQLMQRLGLPARLRDMGIAEDALPALAGDAMQQQRLLINNPRDVTEADALAIYRAAY